jgi:hypothetical protein
MPEHPGLVIIIVRFATGLNPYFSLRARRTASYGFRGRGAANSNSPKECRQIQEEGHEQQTIR